MDELLNGEQISSQTATATEPPSAETSTDEVVAPVEDVAEQKQEAEEQPQEKQEIEQTVSEKTQETKKKPPRFVPYGYLRRIKEERDELRQRLEEQSRLLEEIQNKLLKDEEPAPEEESDEELVSKLLENPREVLRKELSKHLMPLQIEMKVRSFESVLNSLRSKYKDFQEYEPRMVELSRELFPPDKVSPDVLSNANVLERLYMLAKAEKMDEIIASERKKAQEEILRKEEQKEKGIVETGKGGKTNIDYSQLSLAELEKILPKAEE